MPISLLKQHLPQLLEALKHSCLVVNQNIMGQNIEIFRTETGYTYLNQDFISKYLDSTKTDDISLKELDLFRIRLLIALLS